VLGDPGRIRQALQTRVERDGFTATGEVSIHVSRERGPVNDLRFSVRDTGIG
jgi:hypothetical protein